MGALGFSPRKCLGEIPNAMRDERDRGKKILERDRKKWMEKEGKTQRDREREREGEREREKEREKERKREREREREKLSINKINLP